MKGEPEVGSVIEERAHAQALVEQRIALGTEIRTCLRCGRDWGTANLCPHCGFNECDWKVIPPTPVVVHGWRPDSRGGVDIPIFGPDQKKVKTRVSVTDNELDSLRSLRSAIVVLEERLQETDTYLHSLVNRTDENFEVFCFIQQAVHMLWDGNIGDYSLRATSQVTALSLKGPLKALREEIDFVLRHYEEVRKK